jgi:CHASE2 domain-containing sensor protein
MKKFLIDCFLATAFVFLAMWGLLGLSQLTIFNAFDTIGTALSDMDISDYVYSGDMREDPLVDSTIVVVNIGDLSRRQLAEQIQIINKYKPKVIGIDSFFDCPGGVQDTATCPGLRDPLGNLMLSNAIKDAGNVILVTKLLQSYALEKTGAVDVYDSLERSDASFVNYAFGEGYASLETDAAFQDDVKTCRTFNPQMNVSGKTEYAFAVRMALAYDSTRAQNFLKRQNFSEIINYRGNIADFFHQSRYPGMFTVLDVNDVFTENFVPEAIKDKIVIFGFLGKELGDPSWADKFYTPLNTKLAGKANPDMFGVVVHANIVAMILNQDFIDAMPQWQEYLMAFVLCFINVALFSLINTRFPNWYDGITKLLQVVQLIIYTAAMVFILDIFGFKLSITITLGAVALVGDIFEIYMTVIKNLYFKILGALGFTKYKKEVLTS